MRAYSTDLVHGDQHCDVVLANKFQAKGVKFIESPVSDVEKNGGVRELLDEVRNRRFHLLETGDQYVVICNEGVLKIHC
jgi:hypothetical protein